MNDLSVFVDEIDSQEPYWPDSARYDLMVRVRDDYRELNNVDATARAVVASFEDYIPYARDFRMEHGIPFGAKLDCSEVMDAKLATPVTDMQDTLHSAAKYIDSGKNYDEAGNLARSLRDCGEHGSEYCRRACEAAGKSVFGASFDDFLEACQKAFEEAPKKAVEREKEKCDRFGFKEYAYRTLEAYGRFTDAQETAFVDSAKQALTDADMAYCSKVSERDRLYREAQKADREAMENGTEWDRDVYRDYMAYETTTDYDAELKAFFQDYAEVYESVDSDDAKDQLDRIMDVSLGQGGEWSKVKAARAALPDHASVSNELAEAFAKQDGPGYDAWEREHMEDLFG